MYKKNKSNHKINIETNKEKTGFTKLEKSWILYDVGNSAFILMVSTLIPIYFNSISERGGLSPAEYLAYWGYAASIATLVVAFLGPVCGTLADIRNFKKPIFFVSLLVGVVGCMSLGVYSSWVIFLAVYVITKIGYSTSLVFYDAMLGDVTGEEKVDRVSSSGFGWGYIGSCIPFVVCLILVLKGESLGIRGQMSMILSFVIVGIWWLLASVPLLKHYRQKNYVERQPRVLRQSFGRLGNTMKDIRKDKRIFLFLLAYFFYIDGVYTIIEMATAYGQSLGLDATGLLLALLVTQIVAFPSSIVFGKLTKKFRRENLIAFCIMAYTGIALFALLMTSQTHFWILAICVGLFQGGIQALSRSYFARIIPAEKSGEYFGIMDICGKGASFIGTLLVGMVSQITGSTNQGVAVLSVLFLTGLILFRKSCNEEGEKNRVRQLLDTI